MKGYKWLMSLLIAIVLMATVTSAAVRRTDGAMKQGVGCICKYLTEPQVLFSIMIIK